MASKKKAKRPVKKAAAKKKSAAKRAPARKSAAKRAAPKKKASAKRAAPKKKAAPNQKPSAKKAAAKKRPAAKKPARLEGLSPSITIIPEEVPPHLTAKHAPVDDLTSSGDELVDIFQRYDRDRTGQIDREEFARLLEALGTNVNDEELQIALDIVDTDRTGKISFGEFKRWWMSR